MLQKTAMLLKIIKGHDVERSTEIAVVQGIQRICDESTESDDVTDTCRILAVSDIRKGGTPDGF